jgi:hypothetical protein
MSLLTVQATSFAVLKDFSKECKTGLVTGESAANVFTPKRVNKTMEKKNFVIKCILKCFEF